MTDAPRRKSYDLVVVGAGIIGLACGWRCAQRGMTVLVLDRETTGAAASRVAAGMLAPVTEADFGEQALLQLNLDGAALWPDFAAELGDRSAAPIGYVESGALAVAVDRDDAEELRRLHAFQRSLGLAAEWLSGRECRQLDPTLSPRVAGGTFARQDHQVDPQATLLALATCLRQEGGELAVGGGSASLELEGRSVAGVRTSAFGLIGAEQVIVAAGCWSPEIVGVGSSPPIRPVKGQILELRAASATTSTVPTSVRSTAPPPLIRTPRCYVVRRGDGRVVVGATVEDMGFDIRTTSDGVFRLLEAAREALPDIGELEFVAARAGLRPTTPDNAPVVGAGEIDGLVWATGHYRNGVLLAPITADAAAEIVTGGDPPTAIRPFSPLRYATREVAVGG